MTKLPKKKQPKLSDKELLIKKCQAGLLQMLVRHHLINVLKLKKKLKAIRNEEMRREIKKELLEHQFKLGMLTIK